MNTAPLVYLSVLTVILTFVGLFVFREVLRTRKQEKILSRLQTKLAKEWGAPAEHYELGSVYLEKRLYQLAITQFKKALEISETEIPLVHNALGFAYFSIGQYDLAIRHYKAAVKVDQEYLTAWNNLGHAYEKKNLVREGLEAYESVLQFDPNNQTAKSRLASLKKRISTTNIESVEPLE